MSEQQSKNIQLIHTANHMDEKFPYQIFIIQQLLFIASLLYVIQTFQLTTNFLIAFIVSEICILFIYIPFKNTVLKRWISIGSSILSIVVFIVLHRFIMNGLFIIYEQIAHELTLHTGKIFRPMEVGLDGNSAIFATQIFSVYAMLGISLFCYIVVKIRSKWLLYLILLSAMLANITIDLSPNKWVETTFYSVLCIVFIVFSMAKQAKVKEVALLFVLGALLACITFLSVQSIHPEVSYEKPAFVQLIEQKGVTKWEEIRYEKERTNNFPTGNFTQLQPLKINEEVALEIIMSNPSSQYLRGFVGATYTNKKWESLDPSIYDESFDMLFWLNEDGFHPLTQLHTISNMLVETDEGNNVTVQNKHANSKYMYTPYEIKSAPKEIYDTLQELEQSFLTKSFFGERNYTYHASDVSLTKYPSLANSLYENRDMEEVQNYLLYESYYNDFVYDAYTTLPETTEMLLETHIGTVNQEDEKEHVPYEWAIHKITSYLKENIEYDEDVQSFPMDKDFLMYLLENERKGYAPHFATAATTMFRYFGIPARYVEGYIIPPELVNDVDPYEKIQVDGSHAHAWTEIYIDEIGWIPIETTPGFEDKMEKIDLSDYPSGISNTDLESMYEEPEDSFNEAKQQIEDDSQLDDMNNEPTEKLHWIIWIVILVSIILLLCLVTYVVYTMYRRRKLKQFIATFETGDVKTVIPQIFVNVVQLLKYDQVNIENGSIETYLPLIESIYGNEYLQYFERAWNLHQLAIYSKEQLGEQARSEMIHFYEQSRKNIMESKGLFTKLKIKFIDVKSL
ncbi:transglutaminase-like domain-containing protein [Pseudogracilibacillus sp. SO10305]|uniref:transglutaminase-like domain-containing protein n=1 Tax=Pseudogracilibacillus sp. SO10305 TaxID=3098292 RepID=UPI00300DFA4D